MTDKIKDIIVTFSFSILIISLFLINIVKEVVFGQSEQEGGEMHGCCGTQARAVACIVQPAT